jgi:hypothetical protein
MGMMGLEVVVALEVVRARARPVRHAAGAAEGQADVEDGRVEYRDLAGRAGERRAAGTLAHG